MQSKQLMFDNKSSQIANIFVAVFPDSKTRLAENRVHCKPIPAMITGFSLCSISNRKKPVFITGIPANENKFFPVWENYTGKTLFWPCTGLQCTKGSCLM